MVLLQLSFKHAKSAIDRSTRCHVVRGVKQFLIVARHARGEHGRVTRPPAMPYKLFLNMLKRYQELSTHLLAAIPLFEEAAEEGIYDPDLPYPSSSDYSVKNEVHLYEYLVLLSGVTAHHEKSEFPCTDPTCIFIHSHAHNIILRSKTVLEQRSAAGTKVSK